MTSHSNDENLENKPPVESPSAGVDGQAETPVSEDASADNQAVVENDAVVDNANVADDSQPLANETDETSVEESVSSETDPEGVAGESIDADNEEVSADLDESEAETPEEEAPEDEEDEEEVEEEEAEEEEKPAEKLWYILKVQVNREDSIRDALLRRVKIAGLDEFFEEVVVPTEDVAEYNKSGKRRIVKRKLYPGYIMVHMTLNDDTWFLVRETPGIGDFTGSAGKPTPMEPREVQRIINLGRDTEAGETPVKTAIPFKMGERVRVKEGNFLNFEGEVSAIDEANGRVTVMINIFGRSTPVELEHWQIESV